MSRSHPPKGSKNIRRDQIHQASRNIPLWHASMNDPW